MSDWWMMSLLVVGGAVGLASPAWQLRAQGEAWSVQLEPRPVFAKGRVEQAVVVRFPAHTESQPDQFAAASRRATVPPGERVELTFSVRDNYPGPTAGYHFLQARVNGEVVWEKDAAGGPLTEQTVRVEVTKAIAGQRGVVVTLGVWEKKRVTNFPLEAVWTDVALVVEGRQRVALTEPAEVRYEPFPPDLPLPAAPPNLDWTPTASILQPWGRTQWIAVAQGEQWAPRLAEEFGFNAIIMLPPGAHNTTSAVFSDKTGQLTLTEEQFQAALTAYRRAGFKFILYSSIMHCGHAPAWQTGQLTREHPDWSQRDREGSPVGVYGAEWLCPNSPALEYTLRYTQDLVRRYDADAVMLDNNEFFRTKAGLPTCYCEHCQRKFREYVRERFGPEGTRRFFGLSPEEVRIPTEPGDLFNLWIHWRNRVWAEATERFRAGLRAVKPDIVLLANTQYRFADWLLATDLQYAHEDAVLSESRGLTSRALAAKMQLGRALAQERPLWNYVGTFEERDITCLRPAASVASLMGATLAHGANPWIVFYGFAERPEENAASLSLLGRYLRFYRRHVAEFSQAEPYTEVISLLSLRDRNYLSRPLLPLHLDALRRQHIPTRTLRIDGRVMEPRLSSLNLAVVAEGLACLSAEEAEVLAAWVRAGGTLLATPDVGWYDELGRLRSTSALWTRLEVKGKPAAPVRLGKGQVVWVEDAAEIAAWLAQRPPLVQVEPPSPEWEIVPWRWGKPPRLLVHALWHGAPEAVSAVTVTLRLPPDFVPAKALWDAPSQEGPKPLTFDFDPAKHTVRFALPLGGRGVYGLAILEAKPN